MQNMNPLTATALLSFYLYEPQKEGATLLIWSHCFARNPDQQDRFSGYNWIHFPNHHLEPFPASMDNPLKGVIWIHLNSQLEPFPESNWIHPQKKKNKSVEFTTAHLEPSLPPTGVGYTHLNSQLEPQYGFRYLEPFLRRWVQLNSCTTLCKTTAPILVGAGLVCSSTKWFCEMV